LVLKRLTLKTRVVGAAVVVMDCDILKFVRWQLCSRSEIINGNSAHVHASLTLARNSTGLEAEMHDKQIRHARHSTHTSEVKV
jgi:hypothetical protein